MFLVVVNKLGGYFVLLIWCFHGFSVEYHFWNLLSCKALRRECMACISSRLLTLTVHPLLKDIPGPLRYKNSPLYPLWLSFCETCRFTNVCSYAMLIYLSGSWIWGVHWGSICGIRATQARDHGNFPGVTLYIKVLNKRRSYWSVYTALFNVVVVNHTFKVFVSGPKNFSFFSRIL